MSHNFFVRIFCKLIINIKSFTRSQSKRSKIAKINILGSLAVKGGNIILNLLYVPLLIGTLGKDEYGVWLILTSILGFISFFDVGIGNGLRNKYIEAKAKEDLELVRIYISTSYATISIIFIFIGLIILPIIQYLNWNSLLNYKKIDNEQLLLIVNIVVLFFLIRFISQLINVILLAEQKTAFSSSLNLLSNLTIYLTIYIAKIFNLASLLICISILSAVPVIIQLLYSYYHLFLKKDSIKPSIFYVKLIYAKKLFGLGAKFLIIQISSLILFSSTNILIAHLFSTSEVSVYNIAYKYFGVMIMIFSIVLAPMWSAISEAFLLNDLVWIKKIMRKLKQIATLLSICTLLMLLFSERIYTYWVGESISIPYDLSFVLAINTLTYLFFSPYSAFLNGVSKIKLNVIIVTIQTLLFFPVTYLLVKGFGMGLSGIVLSSLICELPLRISQPLQYKLIITGSAKGIWNE